MAKRIIKTESREGAPAALEKPKLAAPAHPPVLEGLPGRNNINIMEEEPSSPRRGRPPAALPPSTTGNAPNMREVCAAELHSPIRMAGKTETNLQRIPNIKMFWVRGEGLLVRVIDLHGVSKESLIPQGSVKIATFA